MTRTMLLAKIANRAIDLGVQRDKIDIVMDLDCVAEDLDLEGLLNARDGDLVHDVVGIAVNLDRRTGKLMNLFWPRYARR